ncbi:hypothetical protein NCAS_0A03570 [Naumovozyma castellii]|uniref:Zn(2)-C6 fungal-type domain-containing protein n=1 Tax=Naumovozyma castellii TaxID=27288 RepID=G0V625_NAUCA|nr:hypothetical protein NCAS_0A03570 [Naumovozyma castellii CBS 4309]CCC66915.1 hypothetical protein NCAS_0A03570 [Naumovozyma castellii CBS 4309]
MVHTSNGKIKKLRSSRACSNCRRRKIKCSGIQPCPNCEIYGCLCVFEPVNGMTPMNFSSKPSETEFHHGNSMHSVKPKTEPSHDLITLDSVDYYFRTENLLTTPVFLISGNDGLYKDDSENQKCLIELQTILKQLQDLPESNPLVLNIKQNVTSQLQKLLNNWEPQIDLSKLQEVVQNTEKDSKSIETELMKNKYRDKVCLARFATWSDSTVGSDFNINSNPILSQGPSVEVARGLFSPIQVFSLRGIAFLLRKYLLNINNIKNSYSMKETVYLMLRIFDIGCFQENEQCRYFGNPLDVYLGKWQTISIPENLSSSIALPNSMTEMENNLVFRIIMMFPQPFTTEITSSTLHDLLYASQNSAVMFSHVVKMFSINKTKFVNFLVRITKANYKVLESDDNTFRSFCQLDDQLRTLCYHYFNLTLNNREICLTLEYLETLLSLLKNIRSSKQLYSFERMLNVALECAKHIGLPRWEYYVGLDEIIAEKRRKLWWELYCLEKHLCLQTGHISSINETFMTCLLPQQFIKVGLLNNKDLLTKINSVPQQLVNLMSVQSLAFYGRCAALQLVGHFQRKILYADRYTSIQNSAKHPILRARLLEETFKEFNEGKKALNCLKGQTMRLFTIANMDSSYARSSDISQEDSEIAKHFVFLYGNILCGILASSTNIVSRLTEECKRREMAAPLSKAGIELYKVWIEMNNILLGCESDYSICQLLKYYQLVFILIITKAFTIGDLVTKEDVITILRVFKRVHNISIFRNNEENEKVFKSESYKTFCSEFSVLGTVTRMTLISYMDEEKIDADGLNLILCSEAPDIADIPELILDSKAYTFKYLLKPVEKSGLHLRVKKMIEDDTHFHSEELKRREPFIKKLTESISDIPSTIINSPSNAKTFNPDINFGKQADGTFMSPLPQLQNGNLSDLKKKSMVGELQDPTKSRSNDSNLPTSGFNIGTLDDFVNNTDLNDLYDQLWSNQEWDTFL